MKPTAIIFDCDGTLCDVSSIRHLVEIGLKTKNFDDFHRSSVDCPPIGWVADAARFAAEDGIKVLVVTARQEKYRALTSFWLAMHKIPSDELMMRPTGDGRPDHEVKEEILARLSTRYDIVKAYDDRPDVVRLWGEYGIPTVVVPGWVE